MKKITPQEINLIRSLRKTGNSLKKISEKVKKSPSTVKKYTDDIILSEDQKKALKQKNVEKFITYLNNLFPQERSERNRKAGLTRMQDPDKKRQFLNIAKKGSEKSGLSYRKDELETLNSLEKLYQISFHKEKIENVYFDFANEYLFNRVY